MATSEQELQSKRAAAVAEIQRLAEQPDLSDGELEHWSRTMTAVDRIDEQLSARDRKIEEIKRYAADEKNIERAPRGATMHNTTNPWRSPVERLNDSEIRHTAVAAIERSAELGPVDDKAAERVVEVLERAGDNDAAAWTIVASDPDYQSAYLKGLRSDSGYQSWTDTERDAVDRANRWTVRASMAEGATATGGALVPFLLDPTVILTGAGAVNPYRQISRVVTGIGPVWHGVSSAGVTAEWTAEAAETTDASPTFVQPTVTSVRADAYVEASYELLQDSTAGAQMAMMFQDSKNVLEATAFTTGTGSTQPEGILTKLQATTASRVSATTNGSFSIVDVYSMVNGLQARAQDGASWIAHWSVFNLIRQFGIGSSGDSAFWADLGADVPPTLLGAPAFKVSSMPAAPLSAATASNDDILILGDFSNYVIFDRLGSWTVSNDVVGPQRRLTGQRGIGFFWRVGAADVSGGAAFKMLRV